MIGIRVQRQVVHSQNIGCCSSYRFFRGLREQRSNSCEKSVKSTTETIFAARDIWLQDVTREFWKKELIDRVYQQLAVRFLGRTSKNLQKTLAKDITEMPIFGRYSCSQFLGWYHMYFRWLDSYLLTYSCQVGMISLYDDRIWNVFGFGSTWITLCGFKFSMHSSENWFIMVYFRSGNLSLRPKKEECLRLGE